MEMSVTNRDSVIRTAEEAAAEIEITEEDALQVDPDQGLPTVPVLILAQDQDHAQTPIVEKTITDIAQSLDQIQAIQEETTEEKIQKTEKTLNK